MKHIADPRRALWCVARRPCVVLSTFVLVTACDHVALPSQLVASGVTRPDTVARSPAADTVAATVDTAVAISVIDSSVVDADSGRVTALAAELPREEVDTRYPVAGRVVRLAADADLQAAIDSASPGDELLLPRGATYVGNFYLPDKGPSNEWIVLRTDVADAELRAEGTRMTPSRAREIGLASIVSPNANSVIVTGYGANHFRFVGVEITSSERVDEINALVRFGDNTDGQHDPATTAHHLVIDRSYLHGEPTVQLRRCVMLNSATSAVVDSWLADCHSNVSDSQAIIGWNGPGPYLIQNNHLEAGHEVVMFGGGGVTTPGVSPADVTIRGNHFTRPVTW